MRIKANSSFIFLEDTIVKYPFWLKKTLAEAGLGNWIPGAANLFNSPSTILGSCSDTILQGDFQSFVTSENYQTTPSPDYLDLSSDHIQGLGMPVQVLPRILPFKDYSPPEGFSETRDAVSNYLDLEYGVPFNPSKEVLITNGIAHAIQTALETFVNPGENVLLPDPCPIGHEQLVRNHGANPIWMTLRHENGRLHFSETELKRQMRKSRVTILSNPSIPTGGVFHEEDFLRIGTSALKNNCLLIWDHSLMGLQLDGSPFHPGNLNETRNLSLNAGSLSISHGISAANVGWLSGNENLIAPCKLLLKMRNTSPSILSQHILVDAIEKAQSNEWYEFLHRLGENRKHNFQKLAGMGFDPFWPAGGPYIWIPIWRKEISSAHFCEELELKYKVLIKPGTFFGPSGAGYARVSFGVDEGRSIEALRRMELYLENKPLMKPEQIRLAA